MNGSELIKTAVEFNKKSFEKSFATIGSIQEKITEKGSEIVEKYSLFPEEAANVISQWATAVRNSMQLFQLVAEKNYTEIENYLSVKK